MKVLLQSRSTLFTVPGGDTTQILKTKEYIEKLGVDVSINLELQPDLSDYDIVHVFNLMRPQDLYLQVRNAKRQHKKIALSTIYGLYTDYEKKARGGFLHYLNKILSITQIEYLKVIARVICNREINLGVLHYLLNGHKRLQRKILRKVDILFPNSQAEMNRVQTDFKKLNKHYIIVPNSVDINRFDFERIKVDDNLVKYKDCVLCVSRIEGRKNQLNVVRAARQLPYKFVFIGKAGPNHEYYYKKCVLESTNNCVFLGQIDHDKLPQYYKLSKVHVLASWMETPGLSSLEAGIMKNNIVITNKGDTTDYFGDYAFYCEPSSVDSIKNAIIEAYTKPYQEGLFEKIKREYKWEDTARETLKGYRLITK